MQNIKYEQKIIIVQNRKIKNLFVSCGSSDLALVFSGFGYTYNMPILYYLIKLLSKKKYDILAVDFEYSINNNFLDLSDYEKEEYFVMDLNGIKDHIFAMAYNKFLLAGKSLGATCCFLLLKDNKMQKNTDQIIWITPGTYADEIYTHIAKSAKDNIVIYGTLDPYTKKKHLKLIQDQAKIIAIEKGDHSLEVDSIDDSIHVQAQLIKELNTMIMASTIR